MRVNRGQGPLLREIHLLSVQLSRSNPLSPALRASPIEGSSSVLGRRKRRFRAGFRFLLAEVPFHPADA